MSSIKEKFEEFENRNYFSRIDNSHPLELHVGLDDKGRKTIELRAQFAPRKVTGTASIAVNQYKKPEYNTIRFSLIDEEISGLFYLFCEDLVEQTREIKERTEGYNCIVNRFFQWKRMFVASKTNILTEQAIMGLIGELLYFRDVLSDKIGIYDALKSWSGQELTHKDFSYNDTWTDVKTVRSGNITVRISSLEQLESDNDGELAVFTLEKMSTAFHGITLNNLVMKIRNMFPPGEDRDKFISEVELQGYEYNDIYDEYVYKVNDFTRYCVNDEFPKLTSRDIDPAIKRATYEIAIADIVGFKLNDEE